MFGVIMLIVSLFISGMLTVGLFNNIYLKRGIVMVESGRYQKALFYFNKSKRFIKSGPDVDYRMGFAYFKMADYRNAAKSYSKCAGKSFTFANVHYNLGCAYFKLGYYDRALNEFEIEQLLLHSFSLSKAL